jgi:type IV secretion system protein VirB4
LKSPNIAPGVIINKDGSLQKSFRFRGPDLDSATQDELLAITARINNVLKRLQGGWAIFVEAHRIKSQIYPKSTFPDLISFYIDKEREETFSAGNHYENNYYFTLLYLPPPDHVAKAESWLISQNNGAQNSQEMTATHHLQVFKTEATRLFHLFQEVMPEAAELTDEETVTYLHCCVSLEKHLVKVPEIPMFLDAFLSNKPLVGGMQPVLGKYHLQPIGILGFPGSSTPGIFDILNRLNFEYRWCSRFISMDKVDSLKELEISRKLWFSKRQSILSLVKEVFTKEASAFVDTDALNKSVDSDEAIQEVSDDLLSMGYFTMTVLVWDSGAHKLAQKTEAVVKAINSLGFTTITETLNSQDAWLGTLPGNTRSNLRRPILSSLNYAHVFPLSAVWAGPKVNECLKGPVLMHGQTPGNTPFRLSLHVGDVGHTMVVGPTGSGKSVHLALIAAQFRRYPQAQIYYFDKDASVRALTAGVGGDFYDLASEENDNFSFQPLAHIDQDSEKIWAAEWVYDFLRGEKVDITPDVKKTIWSALSSLETSPQDQRTITGLSLLIQNTKIRQALEPATINGAFGKLFDSKEDSLIYGSWQVFEMGQLMNTAAAVPPTLSYLFHRIEQRLDGSPTLIVLDECWVLLDNPLFAEKIREWLKVLRKANASVVFATQSLQDIENSTIAAAIMDSCQTKLFLPNPNAREERTAKTYYSFGLNDREIEIISLAIPKKQYYYKSLLGSRLYELALRPFTLSYCAVSDRKSQTTIKELLATYGKEQFNEHWLTHCGLLEAAKVIAQYPDAHIQYRG